jgi:hypothetical protein
VNALQFTERDELGFWELRATSATATLGSNSATRTIDTPLNWRNAIITRIAFR